MHGNCEKRGKTDDYNNNNIEPLPEADSNNNYKI